MADKTINDLTAVTTVNSGDLFELENTGNNSRKITGSNLAKGLLALSLDGAKVRKSASLTAQNITSFTPVTFNSEDWDTGAYHDTGSNTDRLTPPATGYYLVHATAEVANITTGNWIRIVVGKFDSGGSYLKDIALQQIELSTTGTFQLSCSCVESFTAGEFAKMHIQVEADTSVDITTGTWFSMTRIG